MFLFFSSLRLHKMSPTLPSSARFPNLVFFILFSLLLLVQDGLLRPAQYLPTSGDCGIGRIPDRTAQRSLRHILTHAIPFLRTLEKAVCLVYFLLPNFPMTLSAYSEIKKTNSKSYIQSALKPLTTCFCISMGAKKKL